ncbi:MAG TPA: CAP domain-containing protein, partial [Solirubrobacteraceae bacterium]
PALVVLAFAPAAAQARVSCGAEQTATTTANGPQVSDAIFCLTNEVRASYGLPAFRRDARLDASARLHSQDMATRSYFEHVTPEGLTPSARAAAQGYPAGAGENIAYGYQTATAAMVAWMASPGHCKNILSSARDVGIGTFGEDPSYYTMALGDYAFATSSQPRDGCPYALDLATLSVPDQLVPSPTTTSVPATDAPEITAIARLRISGLALSPTRLRPGGLGSVVYELSAPATVTFRVQRFVGGRRAGRHFRMLAGSVTDAGGDGANAFAFRGRLRGRPLAPGRYRLRAVATDDAGSASPVRLARFFVVP